MPSKATPYPNTVAGEEEAIKVKNILVGLGFDCCVRSFNPAIPQKFRLGERA